MTTEAKDENQNQSKECENEDVVTLSQIIEDQDRLNADAMAVLGGQDHTICTYPEGYKPRQPLYSCKTCAEKTNQISAICLGCSFACHEGHKLVELYTKRFICCDCGNSKFPQRCTLYEQKKPLNERNSYNQNYRGLYCICKRPYPDEEDNIDDEMIQCIVCEDWLHSRHLFDENKMIESRKFAEVVCVECVNHLPFLNHYYKLSTMKVDNSKSDTEDEADSGKKRCLLQDNIGSDASSNGAIFWPDVYWRTELCRCSTCEDMYDRLNCSFLTNLNDTVQMYEQKGEEQQDQEEGDQLVDSLVMNMGNSAAVEMAYGYNTLKRKLGDYLSGFAHEGKIVKEVDIRNFFDELRQSDQRQTKVQSIPSSSCHWWGNVGENSRLISDIKIVDFV